MIVIGIPHRNAVPCAYDQAGPPPPFDVILSVAEPQLSVAMRTFTPFAKEIEAAPQVPVQRPPLQVAFTEGWLPLPEQIIQEVLFSVTTGAGPSQVIVHEMLPWTLTEPVQLGSLPEARPIVIPSEELAVFNHTPAIKAIAPKDVFPNNVIVLIRIGFICISFCCMIVFNPRV